MSTCTYDNPKTMCRECWQDGELICWYDSVLYAIKPFPIPTEDYFFGANIGDWKTGQLIGDRKAMHNENIQ